MKKIQLNFHILILTLLTLSTACQSATEQEGAQKTDTEQQPAASYIGILPSWAVSANIYEVNIRQYTEEGTFNAFAEHLPRLKEMEVDILWLMPIHQISKEKRKGTLGSYYAVMDYKGVNPEFGTFEDFQNLVNKAHDLGMYVILDWVPNHTGWDHPWITEHPEWYTQKDGAIIHPEGTDWTDVADLDYSNQDMTAAMIDALNFWVQDYDVDGYRCDVAYEVPDSFWAKATASLRQNEKPLFMLAEAEHPPHRNEQYFNMSYGWSFHHLMNDIAKGEKNANDIDTWLEEDRKKFNKGFHMHFTSNHDENSWNGTVFERMGDGHQTMAVLASTFSGMPLIYSGQEEPLKKRLAFFEKDNIGFGDFEYADFYKTLLTLKDNNKALWNGPHGGEPIRINESESVYAFKRAKDGDEVFVILNLTGEAQETTLSASIGEGFEEVFTNEDYTYEAGKPLQLKPWEYLVISN